MASFMVDEFSTMNDEELMAKHSQVNRNFKRFLEDFMFELTWEEAMSLRSQFATLKQGGHLKYQPYAFTDLGVAMLSSVLNSDRAIEANIAIMRAFAKLRELITTHQDLAKKIDELEKKYQDHGEKIIMIFEAIRQLMTLPSEPARKRSGSIPMEFNI